MLRENPDLFPPDVLKEMKKAAVMKFMNRKPLDDILVDSGNSVVHSSPTVASQLHRMYRFVFVFDNVESICHT